LTRLITLALAALLAAPALIAETLPAAIGKPLEAAIAR